MANTFWSSCNEALEALHRNNPARAASLLEAAKLLLHQAAPDPEHYARRQSHLARLWEYVHGEPTSLYRPAGPAPTGAMAAGAATGPAQSFPAFDPPAPLQGEAGKKLQQRIDALELHKAELMERLRAMPSIDPLCLSPSAPEAVEPAKKEPLGIIVFAHTRAETLKAVLESLRRQEALAFTHVWVDGHQGNRELRRRLNETREVAGQYPVREARFHAGQLGFRKMLILGLVQMRKQYRDILVLEDDCFPTRDAVSEFRRELDVIREDPGVFSVYGHHFQVESEKETCTRFQGWGWATTGEKLEPVLRQLIDCYSMTEEHYLRFVNLALTAEMRARIDVTPPRQPSRTLLQFFAWDETVCLLTAMNGQVHRPTRKRTIYNCGMDTDSTHFQESSRFRAPPFNLIAPAEVWRYF